MRPATVGFAPLSVTYSPMRHSWTNSTMSDILTNETQLDFLHYVWHTRRWDTVGLAPPYVTYSPMRHSWTNSTMFDILINDTNNSWICSTICDILADETQLDLLHHMWHTHQWDTVGLTPLSVTYSPMRPATVALAPHSLACFVNKGIVMLTPSRSYNSIDKIKYT